MMRHIAPKHQAKPELRTSIIQWRVLWLLLACVTSALGTGCPTATSYQPREGMIDTLGVSGAQQLLKDTLLRAVNPRVDDVEVTDDFVRYHLAGTTYDIRLFFKDVQGAEIFNNNVVLIRGEDQRLLARPLLANAQDATTFADLMLSLAQRARSSTR
jgi:hypothetical protein